ncbi:hypothetical protein [Anaerosphaera multitolerans]|uniref:Uncharacterized protein n=1 Tax=Anaerosphaera multitolerans TaxID=2487351 RepID=A0A437S5S4_9FIRM|nr:hypothetical protein [Anaerosphaera multitolerans]RVU54338.1 hypothetical protein EF514_07785 [Anaerosphaera multitolerans]
MNEILVPVLIVVAIFGFTYIYVYLSEQKYLKYLREKVNDEFGKVAKENEIDLKRIEMLFESSEKEIFIDNITHKDLNMDDVLRKLDHTGSILGTQYLYKTLRMPVFNREHHKRQSGIRNYFLDNVDEAKNIKFEFARLGNIKGNLLELIVNGMDYELFKKFKLPVYILTFSIPIVIVSYFILGIRAFFIALILMLINTGVSRQMKKATEGKIEDLSNLSRVLNLGASIGKVKCEVLETELNRVMELNKKLRFLRKSSKTIGANMGTLEMNMISEMIDIFTMM